MLKHRLYIFIFFLRATLNKTFTAKYDGVLPRTPKVRPKSEIYTPKQDDEHLHPFHMQSPPPGDLDSFLTKFPHERNWFLYFTMFPISLLKHLDKLFIKIRLWIFIYLYELFV